MYIVLTDVWCPVLVLLAATSGVALELPSNLLRALTTRYRKVPNMPRRAPNLQKSSKQTKGCALFSEGKGAHELPLLIRQSGSVAQRSSHYGQLLRGTLSSVALVQSSTGLLIKVFIIPETLSDPQVVQEPSVPS